MDNPYAAPQTIDPVQDQGDNQAEAIRKELISNETSIKSIGLLLILGGIFMALAALGSMTAIASAGAMEIALIVFFFAMTLLYFWTGFGLRKLKKGARIPAIVISAIGLLGFPLGTIISAYFLYLLCNQKAGRIFDPSYQEIIAQTPHVKMKTSIIVWIVLALFVAMVVFAIVMAMQQP